MSKKEQLLYIGIMVVTLLLAVAGLILAKNNEEIVEAMSVPTPLSYIALVLCVVILMWVYTKPTRKETHKETV